MSDLKLILDNRCNVSDKFVKVAEISGTQINYFEINAQGSQYASSITFDNVITPSLANTLVARKMRLRYLVSVSATAKPGFVDPTATLGATGPQMALRAWPLQSVCQSATLTINGASTTVQSRAVMSALQRKVDYAMVRKESSEVPVYPDRSACLFQDNVATALTSQQSLSDYWNSDGCTRGSYYPLSYTDATKTFVFEVSEPLAISPLSLQDAAEGLANINTLSLVLNFASLNDMVCRAGAAALPTGFAISISNPKLELTYMQVAEAVSPIPRMVTYPYENLNTFSKQADTMASTAVQATYTMVSDTLRFSSMPELIYVFARPRIDQRTCAQADAFLSLGDPTSASGLMPNISVTLGNRSGLMSSASAKTIYQIAVRNGYQGTWNDWVYGSGSLIMLAPATDLGLDIQNGDILSGEAGSVNFTIQAQFSNANYVSAFGKTAATPLTNLALELVVIPVYKGIATITPDNCVFNLGQLSEAEVSHLLHSADVISSEQVKPTIQGAGLFGRLKSVFGQVARGVQAVAPIAAQVAEHPIVQKLAQQAMGAQGGIISGASLHMRRRR